jgi:hypothetical protein
MNMKGAVLPYIIVYDLSNIQMPVVLSKYNLEMPAMSMVYLNNVIYSLEYGHLEAISVSNPLQLKQLWSINTTNSQKSANLAISCGSSKYL